jgi:aspartyl/asparaginyl-tRNA synthetase
MVLDRAVCRCSVSSLDAGLVGKEVLVRGRLQTMREVGKVRAGCSFTTLQQGFTVVRVLCCVQNMFITLRQGYSTVQGIIMKSTNADLLKFVACECPGAPSPSLQCVCSFLAAVAVVAAVCAAIPKESVVDVRASVKKPDVAVKSASQSDVELDVRRCAPFE